MLEDFLSKFKKSPPPEDTLAEKLNVSPEQKKITKKILQRIRNGKSLEADSLDPLIKDVQQLDLIMKKHMSPDMKLKTTGSGIGTAAAIGTVPNRDLFGYEASGSVLKRIFPQQFQLHAFLADAIWAAAKSRQELWVDTDRDGYVLVAEERVPKKRVKFVSDILDDLNYDYLRNKLRDDLATFGNFVVKPKQNSRGGVLELEPLLMAGMAPMWEMDADKIKFWQYTLGNRQDIYRYNSLDHVFTYSSKSNTIGTPAMFSIVVDIEAALHASVYNNTLMQKGGLIKAILALDSFDKNAMVINDSNYLAVAQELTNWFSKNFGGVRNAGRLVVAPYLKNVFDMGKIGEMDAAWQHLVDAASIKTCLRFGIDPRRLGIPLKSQYENKDQVQDSALLSTDNNQYYTQKLVDEYMNRKLREFGIKDVRVEASGEYNSLSKSAAEVAHLLAGANAKILKVDEFRKRFLHIEGLGGELGEAFIGEIGFDAMKTKDESTLAKALGPAKSIAIDYADLKLVRHSKKYIRFY